VSVINKYGVAACTSYKARPVPQLATVLQIIVIKDILSFAGVENEGEKPVSCGSFGHSLSKGDKNCHLKPASR
jgi:hypothetical protein